jgi:hypothetical protein
MLTADQSELVRLSPAPSYAISQSAVHGKDKIVHTAKLNPEVFFATCARLIPKEMYMMSVNRTHKGSKLMPASNAKPQMKQFTVSLAELVCAPLLQEGRFLSKIEEVSMGDGGPPVHVARAEDVLYLPDRGLQIVQ